MKRRYPFQRQDGKAVIVLSNYADNTIMDHITDYFSEHCRIMCKKYTKKQSPSQVYESNKWKHCKNRKAHRDEVTFHMWKHGYMCQLFKITIVRHLYNHFNAKNVLDFSAGWGDRLIAALSLGIKYTGVDPSVCMAPCYHKIIQTLGTERQKRTCRVIQDGFETVKLKDKYDLIFSSPPFFILEQYESNNVKQSISKFRTLEKWKHGFLYVLIRKCWRHLESKGHFCIHVSDFGPYRYVNDMINYIKSVGFISAGRFYYLYQYEKTVSTPLFVYIFKKP